MYGRSSGWNLNEDELHGQFGLEAPITSFAFGGSPSPILAYGNVTGMPQLVDILMSGSAGVTAVGWLVRNILHVSIFLLKHHYIRVNGLSGYQKAHKLSSTNDVQNYTSLASHAWGSLYALRNGGITEFTLDNTDVTRWNIQGQSVTP